MRTAIAALISVFISVLISAQGAVHPRLESDVYTINQSALTHSAPVAFSIDYPKGWTKTETPSVVNANVIVDNELVCWFVTPFDSSGIQTNRASMTIFRAHGATAKEEAEDLAADLRKASYEIKSLAPVKTKAGDSGYLLMSEVETPNGHRLTSDFFFHIGSKGNIRISIDAKGTFLESYATLQNLVLESLRFPGG